MAAAAACSPGPQRGAEEGRITQRRYAKKLSSRPPPPPPPPPPRHATGSVGDGAAPRHRPSWCPGSVRERCLLAASCWPPRVDLSRLSLAHRRPRVSRSALGPGVSALTIGSVYPGLLLAPLSRVFPLVPCQVRWTDCVSRSAIG